MLKALVILSLIFGVAACQKTENRPSVKFKVAQADLEQAVPSDLDVRQTGLMDEDGANFAFEFYRQVAATTEGNLAFSPYSIRQTFAMVYAGARGNTESQMSDVLHFSGGQDATHARFNGLSQIWNGRVAADGTRFAVNSVNGLWLQDGTPIEVNFLNILAQYYGAIPQVVDFGRYPNESANAINDWVSDQTHGKIPTIVDGDALDEGTFAVIGNAIYFEADWLEEFLGWETYDYYFGLLDGESVYVPTMHHIGNYGFSATEKYVAVAMPFVQGTTYMIILMPYDGYFAEIEAALDAEFWKQLVEADLAEPTKIELALPRFNIGNNYDLVPLLSAMGMTDLFNLDANLSAMTSELLSIGVARHSTLIEVSEEGAIAAGVTVALPTAMALPMFPVVDINHPFIYAIYDQPTGTILFLGRVLNPAE